MELEGGKTDSREYYFAERDLGEGALATMAVRIAPVGKDLFGEWRHYTTPSKTMVHPEGAGETGLYCIVVSQALWLAVILLHGSEQWALPLMGLLVALGIFLCTLKTPSRKPALEDFQSQVSTELQLAVRAALKYATAGAGIDEASTQAESGGERTDRRLI